jgi:two-component system NtrC family sensor kinase
MSTILLIDDDAGFRATIRKALHTKGIDTIEASEGGAGVGLAQQRPPDLILCDVNMAHGDGFSVLTSLRETPATAAIPFILMTGNAGPEEMRRGMNLGADDFLIKPFKFETLLEAVEAQFKKRQVVRQAAEQTKARLVAILEATTDLVGLADLKTRQLLYLNRAGQTMLGLGPSPEFASLSLHDFHPPRVLERILKEAIPVALEHHSWSGETVLVTRQNQEIPISEVLVVPRAPDGSREYLAIIARDITELKKTEHALRRSEQLFRLITENAADLIALVDASGRRLYNSPSYQTILGYGPEDLLPGGAYDLIHPEDQPKVLATVQATFNNGAAQVVEYRMQHKDGSWRILESHGAAIRNGQGTVESILIMGRDVTERKRAERERALMEVQLRQAQKLESLGQLAAGIAHEINTPAQYIGDNVRFLLDAFADLNRVVQSYEQLRRQVCEKAATAAALAQVEETVKAANVEYLTAEIPRAIQESLDGVERVARIVRAMKEFSHPGSTEKTRVDLNHAIESTLTVTRNEWKYVAEMETDFDSKLPMVLCLPGEFNQAILNLVINAAHAIADAAGDRPNAKGTIRVSTRHDGDCAEIRVADTGTGIPEKIRDRIFEPFFTTKPVGKGTGQGLTITRSVIVDKHGGTIRFESEPGQGTTFIIRLPIRPPANQPPGRSK